MAIVWALVVALFASSITSCEDAYDDTDIRTEIEKVAKSVSDLKAQVEGMTYIKSITLGADGKLTITPSTGSAVIYDAKTYVTYDVKLVGNKVMMKGPNDADYAEKGAVDHTLFNYAINADGKLTVNGDVTEADLATWMSGALSLDADNYLVINGQKSDIKIPTADISKLVASLAIEGNGIKVTYQDGTTSVVPNVVTTATNAEGFLTINGVATTVRVQPILTITNGELKINGVSSDPAVKVLDANAMIMNKDDNGNVLSVTLTDASGNTIRIAATPATEPLSGMLFIPSLIDGGVNAIEVGYIENIPVAPATAVKAMFNWQMVNFRMNPTAADLSTTTWAFVNTEVKTRATNDAKSLFKVPTEVKPYGVGAYSYKLEVNSWLEPTAPNNTHLLALEATGKDVFSNKATTVVSDYVKVMPTPFEAFVSNKKAATNYVHYDRAATQAEYAALAINFNLNYTNAEKVNMNDLVLATTLPLLPAPGTEKLFEEYNFQDYTFEFTNISYLGDDNITDQSKFIKIEEDGTLTVLQGTAAISRKPVIKVNVLNFAGLVVATGCVKFEINESAQRPDVYPVPAINGGVKTYESLFTGAALGVQPRPYETNVTDAQDIYMNWIDMNKIYTDLGLSHDKFNEYYGYGSTATAEVSYNGTLVATYASTDVLWTPAGTIERSNKGVNVDTYAMYFAANPYSKFGNNTIKLVLTPKSITYPAVEFTFLYTVKAPVLNKEILLGYQYNRADATSVRGMKMNNPAKPYEMIGYLGSSFEQGANIYRNVFETTPFTPVQNKVGGAIHSFVLNQDYPVGDGIVFNLNEAAPSVIGKNCDLKNEGVGHVDLNVILGTKGNPKTGALIGKQQKLVTSESVYNMNFATEYINGEVDNFIFDVVFVNPLTIVHATGANFTMVDELNPTILNVAPNYDVLFDGKPLFKGQVAQDGTNGTVNAADYLVLPFTGFFYTLDPSKTYITLSTVNPTVLSGNTSKDGIIQWKNGDMKLTTTVVGGTMVYKFVADFAEVTLNPDTIYIQPRN